MKFQAPSGVTALSSAGEDIIPDAQGFFEADDAQADALLAHGCLPAPPDAEPRPPKSKTKRKAD